MIQLIRTTPLLTLCLSALLVTPAMTQPARAPAPLEGKWTGTVTAEMGQMKIAATLRMKDGVVSGELQTAHGVFTIAKGELKAGKWLLPFTTEDGSTGKMAGVVKGDTFEGDWDFSPMAVGTFTLQKTTK
jgi:hypothetical protein